MPRWCRGGPVAPAWFPEAGGRRRRLAGTALGPGTSTGNWPGQCRTAGGRGCTRVHHRPQGGGTSPGDERPCSRQWCTSGPPVVPGGICHRRSAHPSPPHRRFMIWTEAGPWRRLHRTNSGPGARWTGRRRSSTRRSEPGRSRQDRQQAARAVRCPGRPTQRRRVRREHAVQPRPRAAHPRHPRHPVPPRATETPPRQTPRGQAVLFHRTPGLTARAWDRRAHRAARHRLRRTPRPPPLEGRALRERNGCR